MCTAGGSGVPATSLRTHPTGTQVSGAAWSKLMGKGQASSFVLCHMHVGRERKEAEHKTTLRRYGERS